ncbi:ABC transporter permease [Rhizobium terrae]|uniref:ABC transporter permease n=1 Tax=Rhizobium terrae TaxID=2171756 RepID=UPI000E3E6045|nr:ABC transporter permease [Rhizobium terrae]
MSLTELERGMRGELPKRLSLLMIMPTAALLIGVITLPTLLLLATSFTSPELGFKNYYKVNDPLYILVLFRTMIIAGATTFLAVCLGYPVAVLIARSGKIVAAVAIACVLVPLWTPVLIRSYAWIIFFQPNGLVNRYLIESQLISKPLRILYTDAAVVIALTHVMLPYMVLPIANSLKAISPDLPKAAQNLGAGAWSIFWRITLPLSLPGIFAGCLMVFVLTLGAYVTPALLGGPSTLMISTLIGQQITILLDWPFAGALSLVLVVLSLGITAVFRRLLKLERVVAYD